MRSAPELRIVAPKVTGSSPVGHPTSKAFHAWIPAQRRATMRNRWHPAVASSAVEGEVATGRGYRSSRRAELKRRGRMRDRRHALRDDPRSPGWESAPTRKPARPVARRTSRTRRHQTVRPPTATESGPVGAIRSRMKATISSREAPSALVGMYATSARSRMRTRTRSFSSR
jgi:hypothetical protein